MSSRLPRAVAIVACLLLLATPVFAQTPQPGAAPAVTAAPAAPDAVAGGDIWTAQQCGSCHGERGGGDGPSASRLQVAPTAFGKWEVMSAIRPADFALVVKNGRMDRMMPPFGVASAAGMPPTLTDQQIRDVTAYAWTLHTTAREVEAGKALYEANCASCHGADGKGAPGASAGKSLADWNTGAAATGQAWQQVIANGRGTMPAFAGKLDAAQQQAVQEYTRSLSMARMFRGPLPAGSGVISGTVSNGTTGQPMTNQQVRLLVFEGASQAEERSSSTDGTGLYRFEGLPTGTQYSYAVTSDYPAGFPYGTEPKGFAMGATAMDLPLRVYESTADATGVRIDRAHFIVEVDEGQLLVAELYVFGLDGNRTYAGDGKSVLQFTLPAGAFGLTVNEGEVGPGERFVETQDGFADTLPLPPGNSTRQILFRYAVPVSGQNAELIRVLKYKATAVNGLVADVGAQVTSAQLANQGTRAAQNASYINLVGQNIAANQPISIKLANIPAVAPAAGGPGVEPPAAAGLPPVAVLAIVALVGVAAGALIAVPLARRRTAPAIDAPAALDRESLLDELADLEAAHEAGEIGDAEYTDERRRIKAQLVDLARREGPA